ncbi:MAG: hypothetical protein QF830_06795 [Rhodospirillales bacterium]|nr:hypothetical protein [Rhodospirillales bacterium]
MKAITEQRSRPKVLLRELNAISAALILMVTAVVVVRWAFPDIYLSGPMAFVKTYVGAAWPFFAAVGIFVFYVMGAWLMDIFGMAAPRNWTGISEALHWATEACPLVGLLTTFLSLLLALLTYGEAGPGQPETQAAFITQFAIAFGSSIAGGILALIAFTLHRVLPEIGGDDV